ncbi:Methionine aminopeptidase [Candidatus Phytoplasma pini]|uniref:Methionine aminopeptidase n=2 Tax=Candidatus Phytoplasma pini TaxID=267362 RepID=A0A559KJR9_9MOLU|nr:Methionine aminopeptidase [Candidatus Phytoplasma pini]
MRKAGKILSLIKKELSLFLKEGISTLELDMIACDLIKKHGVISAFKNYKNFNGYTCISVNETVVHGVPSKTKVLKSGDIVTLDLGIKYKNYYVDCAYTYMLGDVSCKVKELLRNTENALILGIEQIKPKKYISNITSAINSVGRKYNYGIVEIFSGHGIGKNLHEEPYIFNFDFVPKDYVLKPGMVFCIEPMFTLGSKDVYIENDGWTAVTVDRSLSAHFEHTVLVTDKGYEILTN